MGKNMWAASLEKLLKPEKQVHLVQMGVLRKWRPIIEKVFEEFWNIGGYNEQNTYIQKLVTARPVKHPRKPVHSDAPGNKRGEMLVDSIAYKNQTFWVFRAGFLAVFGLKWRRVKTAVKRVTETGTPLHNKRGKTRTLKIKETQVNRVK